MLREEKLYTKIESPRYANASENILAFQRGRQGEVGREIVISWEGEGVFSLSPKYNMKEPD